MNTLTTPGPAGPSRHRPVRQGLIAVLVALALVAVAGGVLLAQAWSSPRPAGSSGQSGIAADVSGQSAWTHLEALQRIADANGGHRSSPSPGYDASVDYVAGALRDAGFDVTIQEFAFTDENDRPATSRNVIAQTRTGDPRKVVMAGAHLDSVPQGPGINDNATGVASLLEIATTLGGSPSYPNAIRFAFWGAEEPGLYGSAAYVQGLSPADRSALRLYLNLDMLGSPNAGYFVQGGVGRGNDEAGPAGSAEVARVLVAQLAAVGATAETTEFDGGSDFEAFLEAGVPTGGLYAGDKGRKSRSQAAQWGGEAREDFDPCYHRSCDTIKNVDTTAFDRYTDASALTIVHFATAG